MKPSVSLLIFVFLFCIARSQNVEYVTKNDFQQDKKKISENIAAAKKQVTELKKLINVQKASMDSLKSALVLSENDLRQANDSLVRTAVKLNSLQEQVDQQKSIPMWLFLTVVVVTCLLFIVAFILIFLFKKSAGDRLEKLEEGQNDLTTRLNTGLDSTKEEIIRCTGLIHSSGTELKEKIASATAHFEQKTDQVKQKMGESISVLEAKINSLKPEITGLRDELKSVELKSEKSAISVKADLDTHLKEMKALLNSSDQERKEFAAKLKAELESIKGQLAKPGQEKK